MYVFNGEPILIRPINPVVFRWGGEYSPVLTGPMNKGSSEPFPLPSTIAGFLYWINQGYSGDEEVKELDIQRDYETLSKVEIFGPFFYAKGKDENGSDKVCLAIHQYPKKLTTINEECATNHKERTSEPVYISKISIGHDISKKQAHTQRGLIYTVEYADYYATAIERLGLKEVEDYGILVYTNAKIKEGFYPFGSEGRVVEVKGVEDVKVKIFDSRAYILSPIILKANESPSPLIISSDVDNLVVDENNGKKITVSDLAFNTIRLSLIGLGFNVKYNVKRPIYLAIMPGKIEAKDKKEKEKFNALLNKLFNQKSSGFVKLGLFDKIWGSILIGGGHGG